MYRSDLTTERKTQIIKATIDCISRHGYSSFSMQDVANAAEMSKGIIHYYFLNKEDLMMAVFEYVSTDIENLLLSAKDPTGDPITHLTNVIWLCAGVVQTKREFYRISMDFWTQIDQKEKIRTGIAHHYSKFRTTISNIIQEGMKRKVFRQGDAQNFATVIIALIDGISLQWLFDNTVFNYDDVIANCVEAVMNLLRPSISRKEDG